MHGRPASTSRDKLRLHASIIVHTPRCHQGPIQQEEVVQTSAIPATGRLGGRTLSEDGNVWATSAREARGVPAGYALLFP